MSDARPTPPPAVDAHGLTKCYERGEVRAVDGIDLRINAGEFVAICGPSGCGKSTLLNLVSAIDRPDAGTLNVCGHDLGALADGQLDRFRAKTVGLVFQLHNLLPNLTAHENVQVAMLAAGVDAETRVQRAADLLARVGLSHKLRSRPPQLSGGERQRVAVARALANQPPLLLADEPTGALDSHTGERLFDLLAELRREHGTTLVVVTHDAHVASRAERIVHMVDGKLVDHPT